MASAMVAKSCAGVITPLIPGRSTSRRRWQIASDARLAAGEILHDHAGQSLPHGTEQAEIRECDQPLGVVPITGKDNLALQPEPFGPRFDDRVKRPVAREYKHRVG